MADARMQDGVVVLGNRQLGRKTPHFVESLVAENHLVVGVHRQDAVDGHFLLGAEEHVFERQFRLGPSLLADIDRESLHADRLARFVVHGGVMHADPDFRTVLANVFRLEIAVGERIPVATGLGHADQHLAGRGGRFGRHGLPELEEQGFFRRISQKFLDRGAEICVGAGKIHLPENAVDVLGEEPEPPFAFPELVLRPFALADVASDALNADQIALFVVHAIGMDLSPKHRSVLAAIFQFEGYPFEGISGPMVGDGFFEPA